MQKPWTQYPALHDPPSTIGSDPTDKENLRIALEITQLVETHDFTEPWIQGPPMAHHPRVHCRAPQESKLLNLTISSAPEHAVLKASPGCAISWLVKNRYCCSLLENWDLGLWFLTEAQIPRMCTQGPGPRPGGSEPRLLGPVHVRTQGLGCPGASLVSYPQASQEAGRPHRGTDHSSDWPGLWPHCRGLRRSENPDHNHSETQ